MLEVATGEEPPNGGGTARRGGAEDVEPAVVQAKTSSLAE